MATDRQIAANRRNSERSTGPKSEDGKSRSRLNATKHGLASERVEVESGFSPEFEERRAKWGAEHDPVGEAGAWALDRAVAASLRIERCERAIDDHIATVRQRAKLAWDEDRAVEAATLFGRLARDPILASRQLQATLAGVTLLMEAWLSLLEALGPGEDWSESERSMALDLLGVAPGLRDGRMPIDAPEGSDPATFRKSLAIDELDRLESLRDEALIPLDELERRQAMRGDVALLSKPAKLLLRYEREAWTHYNRSMKEVKDPTPPPVVVPALIVAPPPRPPEKPKAPPQPSFEERRRALQAEGAPYRKEATDRLAALGFVDEDAMLDELERRLGMRSMDGPFAPERTQFGVLVEQGA